MPTARAAKGPPLAAVLGRADPLASLVWIFPLFLLYEAGVIFSPVGNGVDFVTRWLWAASGYHRGTYLLIQCTLAAIWIVALMRAAKRGISWRGRFLPILLESAIVALLMGTAIVFVMQKVMGLGAADQGHGPLRAILLSFGAGVHEELVFRLGLFSGGAALLRLVGTPHRAAVAIAFVISSIVFSAVHHLGPLGDPWALDVFVYRVLAGMIFALVYYHRSLAHAVYTHALYDVYVMVIR